MLATGIPAPSRARAGLLAAAALVVTATAPTQDQAPAPQLLAVAQGPIAPGATLPQGGGPGGLWCAGLNYKVSLHDGFMLFPHVGPDLEHQPVRWTTTSVRIGGTELADLQHAAVPLWHDRHCEYDLGGAVECYDLGASDVEQTFRIAQPMGGSGELVILGRMATPLQLPATAWRHGKLALTLADGRPVVEYGAATAIDALGNRFPMETSCDGDTVGLRLAASAVAQVKWPLVVDPLLGNTLLLNGAPITDADVLHETLSATGSQARTWVAYAQLVAANDHDLFVQRFATNFGGVAVPTFQEISAWDSEHPSLALAVASNEVVVGFQAGPNGGAAQRVIAIHQHGVNDLALRTGIGNPFGTATDCDWRPRLASSSTLTNELLVVFQRDAGIPFANTANSAILVGVFDTVLNAVVVVPVAVHNRPARDQERPTVNHKAAGNQWIVAFQEHDGTVNDDWDIVVKQVDDTGAAVATGVEVDQAATGTLHKLAPHLDGKAGRYCLGYVTQQFQLPNPKPQGSAGEVAFSQRIDVDAAGTGSLPWPVVTLASRVNPVLTGGGIAFDTVSRSHWATAIKDGLTDTYEAMKLGYQGATTETPMLVGAAALFEPDVGGVAFNDSLRQFMFAFGRNDGSAAGNELAGNILSYDTMPAAATYGFSCGSGVFGDVAAMADHQQIGAQGLKFQLVNAPEDGFGLLVLSLVDVNAPLDDAGMTGCTLLVDLNPFNVVGQYIAQIQNGNAHVTFDLPEYLTPVRVVGQWGYPATGANPLGFQASDGIDLTIGR